MRNDMQWWNWSEEAFESARETGRPVILFVKASWCRWCRELERDVLADPRVEELLEKRFVGIMVDKDRRPDIDARYSKGGWPTLAYLDDAGELLAQDTYLEVEPLCARLELVSDYYVQNREAIRVRIREIEEQHCSEQTPPSAGGLADQARRARLSLELVDTIAETVLESSDPVYGGWGSQHKFPHPEAIDFALIRWSQTGDQRMYSLVTRTLRHMQEGEIHDSVEGGLYRYATQPDWSVPHHEKMLDSNAQRLFAYLEAYQATGVESFKKTADGILRWMLNTLLDSSARVFRGSQDANPAYAHLTTLDARRRMGAPECDPTVFTNWNAMAASSLFKASAVLQEDRYRIQALDTIEFLMENLFDESKGMYHYWDGSYHLPGLLTDQAYTLRALLDAMQYSGENRYLPRAERLANLTIELLRSEGGGFYDTLYDPHARGGLRRRNRSILENSVMAEALLRLHHFTRETDYADAARETLESFVHDYKRYGHFVAGYARAVDLLYHEPVHVTIVGKLGAPSTRALAEAALGMYVASRVVQILDPEEDRTRVELFGLPVSPRTPGSAHAYVHRGRESYAETSDPARLPALMTRVERSL